jgi:hypothetical protein
MLLQHDHLVSADNFPLLATDDALFKVRHAAFNVAAKHVSLINLSFAARNDLVADTSQENSHFFASVIRMR